MAQSLYLILDMEYPRLCIVTIDAVDRAMTDLRASMN